MAIYLRSDDPGRLGDGQPRGAVFIAREEDD